MSDLVPDCYDDLPRPCPYPEECTECLPTLVAKEGVTLGVWAAYQYCLDRNIDDPAGRAERIEQLAKLRLYGFNTIMTPPRAIEIALYLSAGWQYEEMVLLLPSVNPDPINFTDYNDWLERWLGPFLRDHQVRGAYFEEMTNGNNVAEWNLIDESGTRTHLQGLITELTNPLNAGIQNFYFNGYAYNYGGHQIEGLFLPGNNPPMAHSALNTVLSDVIIEEMLALDPNYLDQFRDAEGNLTIQYPMYIGNPIGELVGSGDMQVVDDSYYPPDSRDDSSVASASNQSYIWRQIRDEIILQSDQAHPKWASGGVWIGGAVGPGEFTNSHVQTGMSDPEELNDLMAEFADLNNIYPYNFDSLFFYQGDLTIELAHRFLSFFSRQRRGFGDIGPQHTGSGEDVQSPCDSFLLSREFRLIDNSVDPSVNMNDELYRLCHEDPEGLEAAIADCIDRFVQHCLTVLFRLPPEPGTEEYMRIWNTRGRIRQQFISDSGATVDDDLFNLFVDFLGNQCGVFRQYACKLYDIRLQEFVQAALQNGILIEDYSVPGHTVYCRCSDCVFCQGKDPYLVAYWRATPNCTPPITQNPNVSCCRQNREPLIPCEPNMGERDDEGDAPPMIARGDRKIFEPSIRKDTPISIDGISYLWGVE